jgi:hypothetical protein
MSEYPEQDLQTTPLDNAFLQQLQMDLNTIQAPVALDQYVKRGIAQGKVLRLSKKRYHVAIFAACLVILAVLAPIRISSTYAALLSKIPGLDYIVKLIADDHGLVSAVQNNFVQPINKSDEHEGLMFTVNDIIVDESRLVMFYTITDKGNHSNLDIAELNFYTTDGKSLAGGISWGGLSSEIQLRKGLQSEAELSWPQGTVIPKQVVVKARFKQVSPTQTSIPDSAGTESRTPFNNAIMFAPTWQVTIDLNQAQFKDKKQQYALNQTVTVSGQKLTFTNITIYPTRISVDLAVDPQNSKRIFYFDDLCIVDDMGNKVAAIANGISGTYPDETHRTLYFQSNYFDRPQHLYLEGHSIRALDKDLTTIKVDLANKRVFGQLPDQHLTLANVTHTQGQWVITWKLKVEAQDLKHAYNLFSSEFLDSLGKEHPMVSTSTSLDEDGYQEVETTLSDKDLATGPVTLQVEDYPTRIQGEFRIKIK